MLKLAMKFTRILANIVLFSMKREPFKVGNCVGLFGKSTSLRAVLGIQPCAQ